MKFGSRLLRCIFACTLVLGLMPTLSFAEEPVRFFAAEDAAEDAVKAVPDEGLAGEIQLFGGVQDDVKILEEGDFGEDNALHWAYRDDASLTISGTGAIPDYTEKGGQPWNAYIELAETVQIDEGVTRIGAYAFYSFNLIVEMSFPETLESLGEYALAGMTCLKSVELPDSVTELGKGAFFMCQGMQSCRLSENIKRLPEELFYRCSNLEEVNIPSAAESIGKEAFYHWGSEVNVCLKSPTFPSNLKTLEKWAFHGVSLVGDLVIPNTLVNADTTSFWSVDIKGDVIFENGCGSNACSMWTYTAADKVRIPGACAALPKVSARYEYVVDEDNSLMVSFEGCLYSKQGTYLNEGSKSSVLRAIPTEYSGELIIPEGVEMVPGEGGAFISEGITRVQVPSTVSSIPYPGTTFVGKSVTAIDVSPDNPYFTSIDGVLFTKDEETLLRFPLAHPQQQYRIPSSVKRLGLEYGRGPFAECSNLKSVIIPSGVETIKGLYCCSGLVSIYVPRTVTSIDADFLDQKGRTGITIFYEGTKSEWDDVKADRTTYGYVKDAVIYFDALEQGINDDGMLFYIDHDRTLHIVPDEKAKTISYVIKDVSTGAAAWSAFQSDFDSVRFSNAITTIGANAFRGCKNIADVVIPSSVTVVGAGAFAGCSALREVECRGNSFQVVAASEVNPSFDESTVTLLYQAVAQGWTDSPAYDATSSRWNGYRLAQGEQGNLPTIGNILIVDNGAEISETRVTKISWEVKRFKATVLSAEGEDITDKVSISITAPERERPVTAQARQMYNRDELYEVSFLAGTHELSVGGATAPGTYCIEASPIQGEVSGGSFAAPFNVTRDAERLFWCTGNVGNDPTVTLTGNRASEKTTTYRYDAWNQYGESVWDRCDIRFIDTLSETDVTDQSAKTGLSLDRRSENLITISQLAVPRNYGIKFLLDSEGRHSEFTGNLYIKRNVKFLNDPWSLTLSGGDDEVYPQEQDSWTSAPYRVRVLDCYEDPCWPTLSWKINKVDGEDAQAHFELDEQGYLKIKPSAQSFVAAGGASLSISSMTTGHDYQGSTAIEALRESNVLSFQVKAKQPDPEPVTHTATFKVGDEVMGVVTFAEGDASLETPAMPPKINYIGSWKLENGTAWDDFDLSAATSDLIVVGEYTPLDPDKVSDITTGGDAKYEDGAVTVNLRASASSRNVRVESSSTKPVDVVLVCDQSGSMDKPLGEGISKQQALINCANSFANSLFENAKKTGADHRIALVGFASTDRSKYKNTRLLATNSGGATGYPVSNSEYADALMPINQNGSINTRVTTGIASIAAEGATAADLGLGMAKSIFANNPVGEGTSAGVRERIVLFITDGAPTAVNTSSAYASSVSQTAADAITEAKSIKQSQGARIYSVGVDAGANASANDLYDSKGLKIQGNTTLFDFNRFLHLVSSNYPAATSMANKGEGSKDGGYYMPVANTGSLDSIFTTILYTSVYEIQTFERATIRYEVPSGLALTLKQEEEMRADLEAQGVSSDDITVMRDGDKTVITFSNIPVKQIRDNGVPEYVAQVSFKLSAKAGVSGSVSMGSAELDCMGDESTCSVTNVSIPPDRCAVVFMLDGQPYEIRDLKEGDAIELPDTDLARWMALEKLTDDQRVAHGATVVFETTSLSRTYALRWVINENEKVENLAPGAKVETPDVSSWIPDGYELAGWVPAPPLSMPSESVTCTAVLTKSHVHVFTASTYKTGFCTEGMTVHEVCACGEEQTHQEPAKSGHTFATVLSSDGSYTNSTKKLVCKECGYSVEKDMDYEAAANDDDVVVLDLTKLESDVAKPGESADNIEIQYFMDADDGEEYTVTRIDEDDTRTEYSTTVRDGYLWFYPNHFSIYVVGSKDESGHSSAEDVTYANSLERLQRAAAEAPVVTDPPYEDTDGPGSGDNTSSGGNGVDGPGTNPGNNNANAGSGSGGIAGNDNVTGGGIAANDNGIMSGTVPIGDAQRNNTNVGALNVESASLAQTGDEAMPWAVGSGSVAALALVAARLEYVRRRKSRAA